MEQIVHEPRFAPAKHRPRWPLVSAYCLTAILCTLIVTQSNRPAPCEAQANVQGPFRPRPKPPKPEPPVPPAPQPENDAERKLFPRIEALIEARAVRIENRAAERAEQQVEEAFNEVADNMALSADGFEPAQGSFGGVFVAKLMAFVKKLVMFAMAALLLTVIGGLIVKYWFIVGPVGAFLFIVLPAWSARTFGKK